jgi:hypothetical protein
LWYVVNCVPFMNFMVKVILVVIWRSFAHVFAHLVCRMEQWRIKETLSSYFYFHLCLFQVNKLIKNLRFCGLSSSLSF